VTEANAATAESRTHQAAGSTRAGSWTHSHPVVGRASLPVLVGLGSPTYGRHANLWPTGILTIRRPTGKTADCRQPPMNKPEAKAEGNAIQSPKRTVPRLPSGWWVAASRRPEGASWPPRIFVDSTPR